MATTKKAAETAENTEVSAAETTADTVTIEKSQLDKLLGMYDELQEIKKSMPIDRKAEKIKQDKELAKMIEKANKESEELVEYIAPTGSMKSNKNIEVNINGVQYTVPRGVKTNIPRKVAEIIDNSIKQAEFAQGVQDKAAEIAQQLLPRAESNSITRNKLYSLQKIRRRAGAVASAFLRFCVHRY